MKAQPSRFAGRAWPVLLLVPLVAVPVAAFFVLTGNDSGRLPTAQGVAGGFHPVAGSFVPDETRLGTCGGRYSCLEQAFGNIAFAKGPKRALELFDLEITRDAHVERDCHRIVHTIGAATYARYGGNVARTFAEGSSVCASGYYHGILERAFVGITSKRELGRAARTLCLAVGIRRRSFLDYQCRHGLGHGFMIQTGYDLPTALSLCSSLGTGWDRVTCTSGAFMENVSTSFGYRSPWLDEEDPFYPCDRLARKHRRSCFLRATTWMLELDQNDFRRTADRCLRAAEWASACFRGFGRDAVVEANYRDLAKVHELCSLSGRYAGDCYFGAGRTFADGEGLDGVRRSARFCMTTPALHRSSCVGGFGVVIGLVYPTPSARLRACAELAGRNAAACATAAAAEVDPSGRDAWG